MEKNKCILLDRDGVINVDKPESVTDKKDFILIESSLEAINLLHRANFKIIVITNQACVGRGELELEVLEEIHGILQERVNYKIDDFFICSHTDEDNCNCRKPKPGLILKAKEKWNFEMQETFLVGDAKRDIEAAFSAGCKPIIVQTGKISNDIENFSGIPIYKNLLDFTYDLVKK